MFSNIIKNIDTTGVPELEELKKFFIYIIVLGLVSLLTIMPVLNKIFSKDPVRRVVEAGHFKPMVKDFNITEHKEIYEKVIKEGKEATVKTHIFAGSFIKTRRCDFLSMQASDFYGNLSFIYTGPVIAVDIDEQIINYEKNALYNINLDTNGETYNRSVGLNFFNNWKIRDTPDLCAVQIIANHKCTPVLVTVTMMKNYYDTTHCK